MTLHQYSKLHCRVAFPVLYTAGKVIFDILWRSDPQHMQRAEKDCQSWEKHLTQAALLELNTNTRKMSLTMQKLVSKEEKVFWHCVSIASLLYSLLSSIVRLKRVKSHFLVALMLFSSSFSSIWGKLVRISEFIFFHKRFSEIWCY